MIVRRLIALLAWLLCQPTQRRPVVDDTAVDVPACTPACAHVFPRESTDPTQAELDHLQGLCSQWVVMWGWYRREYLAIARFDTATPILFDADPQRLVFACREAELAVAI